MIAIYRAAFWQAWRKARRANRVCESSQIDRMLRVIARCALRAPLKPYPHTHIPRPE